MKYLRLKFHNAKLFEKDKYTKDFISTVSTNSKGNIIYSREKRKDRLLYNFISPITVYQISNVLHVLSGERPVPSLRETFYRPNNKLFDIALSSYLRIDSPMQTIQRDGSCIKTPIKETVTLSKSPSDSWSNNPTQWFKIQKYLSPDLFNAFTCELSSIAGYDVTSEPFINLRFAYNKYGNKIDPIINLMRENKKTPIINFLKEEKFDKFSEITSRISCGLGETVNRDIDKASFLSGEILVPASDDFLDNVITNTANILDGGIVKIVGLVTEQDLQDVSDFVKVADISTKMH